MTNISKLTSPEQIERFKKEFERYQNILNLQDYDVEFRLGGLGEWTSGEIRVDVEHRSAIVWLSHVLEKSFDVEKTAKHEAIHLFLSPLRDLVNISTKYSDTPKITESQLTAIEESMVRMLTKVII